MQGSWNKWCLDPGSRRTRSSGTRAAALVRFQPKTKKPRTFLFRALGINGASTRDRDARAAAGHDPWHWFDFNLKRKSPAFSCRALGINGASTRDRDARAAAGHEPRRWFDFNLKRKSPEHFCSGLLE